MNEVTAAVGLAQLEKIDGILATYAKTLAILNKAIEGCPWLKPRHVPRRGGNGRLLVGLHVGGR